MAAQGKTGAKRKARRAGIAPRRGGAPDVRGQPAFVPTEGQRVAVMGLVSVGTEQWAIAEALKIPLRTLVRHFAEELAKGRGIIHARVGGGIVASALSGNLTAQIFYAKAQMGWRDRWDGAGGQEPANASNLFTIDITG